MLSCLKVIKETLRFRPLIPFVGRQTVEDTQMGPYVVPEVKKSTCVYVYVCVHAYMWYVCVFVRAFVFMSVCVCMFVRVCRCVFVLRRALRACMGGYVL